MSDAKWAEAAELFADLLDVPEAQRHDALEARTEGRAELRSIVARLLAAHDEADTSFLDQPDEAWVRDVIADVQGGSTMAGPYRLVREIGRGGMGTVHLAERADGQFEQRVAVKMLKRGMDSEAILDRFLRERQILAGFKHPNIARLFDGGIADDGRPFLVMEYVQGTTITDYCDEQLLSVDDRLQLYQQVCDAVAYAHRNLVVHRDLKPSNILVADDGEPKLLDFGIAKVLQPTDEPGTATTQVGVRLLTPEYAAPEQLAGGAVTTSTDVFGLGAVLYELLCGRRPFEHRGRLDGTGTERAAGDATAASVSHAIDPGSGSTGLAAARRTDPMRLRRRLSGDLDTIVAKALRPEPDQRYASVEALQDDLRRHLEQLPIRARPATLGYRLSRFVRRHRTGVAATAAIGLLLVAFGITATMQAVRIQSQALALAAERDRAQVEAATAEEVADFMVGVFEVSDPLSAAPGDSITARTLLDRGAERIEVELATNPGLKARLLDVIASAYVNLGLFERAEALALSSVDARREAFGEDDVRVARSLDLLGQIRSVANDYDGAEEALLEAISLQEGSEGDELDRLGTLVEYSKTIHQRGDHGRAAELARQVAQGLQGVPSGADSLPREALWEVAAVLEYAADWDAASAAYGRLAQLEIERGGPLASRASLAFMNQAMAERARENPDVADSLFRRAVEIRSTVSPDDVATATLLIEYGNFRGRQRDFVGADSLLRAALSIQRAQLDSSHVWIGQTLMGMGVLALEQGQPAEAAARYDEAVATFRAEGTREASVLLPVAVWRAGEARWRADQPAEGEERLRSALSMFESAYPDDYLLTANVRRDLGTLLVEMGDGREALPILEAALGVLARRWGDEDFRSDGVRVEMARAHILIGQRDQARAILEVALPRLESQVREDHEYAVRAREAAAVVGLR